MIASTKYLKSRRRIESTGPINKGIKLMPSQLKGPVYYGRTPLVGTGKLVDIAADRRYPVDPEIKATVDRIQIAQKRKAESTETVVDVHWNTTSTF